MRKLRFPSPTFSIEAVEKRTFACLQKEVYEVFLTLKEAEERFGSLGFVRISKSVVVNLYRVRSIKNDFEMRTLICLDNQENLVISRHYRTAFFSAVFALIGIAVLSQSYRLDGLSPLRAGILLYLITLSCVLGIVWLYGCFLPLHPDAFRDIFFSFSIPWFLFALFYFRRLKRETNRMDREIRLLRGSENPDG